MEERVGERRPLFIELPSPRPSPHSCLAARGGEFLVVVSSAPSGFRGVARFFPLAPLMNLLQQCRLKMEYLWIALGSALGGVARYWLSGVVARRFGESFPVGTLIVNVTGSFVIGFVATLTDPGGRLLMSVTARQFVMLGVLGGYTTFSSFSLQTLNLARDGEWLYASANVVLSVILCLLAVWVGQVIARMINR